LHIIKGERMPLTITDFTTSNLAYIPFVKAIIKAINNAAKTLELTNAAGKKIELDEKHFNQLGKIESVEAYFGTANVNYVQVIFTGPFSCKVYCNHAELFPKIATALTNLEKEVNDRYEISLEGRDVRTAK
jgi:hypothetical protein